MENKLTKWIGATVLALSVTSSYAITYTVNKVESWNYTANLTLRGVNYKSETLTAINVSTTDSSVPASQRSIWTYCTDMTGTLDVPQTTSFDMLSGAGQKGLDPNNPWGNGGFQNAAFLVSKYGTTAASDPVAAAGLQLAVWKSLYDSTALQQGNFSFNNGNLRLNSVSDSAVLADANAYLASLGGSDYQAINNYWLKPSVSGWPGNVGQGLIDPVAGGSVPDAGASVGLMSMVLTGLLVMRKK